MCGIAGGIGDGTSGIVRKFMPLLSRRGPDYQGVITTDYGLTLGASRLAITDPSPRSNQPMVDQSTGNVIIFNGEIYNYKILKKKLLNLGITFSTESDTEVLLKLLGHFGISVISQLEGMFAFAFLDYKTNTLILSRDYLGKKPLYYALSENRIFFSSSFNFVTKSLKNLELNLESIATYLSLGYSLDPNTLIKRVLSLQPGHALEVNLSTLAVKSNFYPPDKLVMKSSMTVEQALHESIQQRTDGHSSFAISMSGGVDSSLIAMQCKNMGLEPDLYSLGFSNSDKARYNNDATAAELIALDLKLRFKLIEMPSSSKIPTVLEDFIEAMEEPNGNPTGLSMMILYSSIAKDGHRIVLTGDGSDEIFGGYLRYQMAKKVNSISKIKMDKFRTSFKIESISSNILDKVLWSFTHKESFYHWLYLHQVSNTSQLKRLFNKENDISFNFPLINLLKLNFDTKSNVPELMFKDLSIWLSMESNKKLDRISMWHSIEARSPFQSEDLVRSGYEIMKSFEFNKLGKKVLFQKFPDLYSLPILTNKSGFISPLGHWLRSNPEMIKECIDYLKKISLFNAKELSELSKAPINGEYKKFKLLWSLLVLSKWARKYNL
jgi:asparagine synthase (glutamine-hydrolysing)